MDPLVGLPDFDAVVATDGLTMYRPFGAGSYSVLPRELALAQDAEGKPRFSLMVLKRVDDLSTAGQYCVLDLSLAGDFPLGDALARARDETADATVRPANINLGFARLYSAGSAVMLPADMTTPTPLGWSGPDFVRWTMRLSVPTGELIKGAIVNGTLLFGARVEFEVLGVAPRLPVTVQFQPQQLIDALLAGKQSRQISNGDLVAFFTGSVANLPLTIIGTLNDGRFAQVMADRIVAAYGSLVPSSSTSDSPLTGFPDGIDHGTVSWDLSQAVAVPRHWMMALDPLTSLRAAAASGGVDGLIKEITVPPLDLGFRSIDLAANLPASRTGVPAIGVALDIPANPPHRPNAISQTMVFTPPADQGNVKFRLSADEPLRYALSPFAVIAAGQSVHQYAASPRSFDGPWVQLQARDFPVTFAHLTAADRLLALADVTGLLRYTANGKMVQQPLALSVGQPDLAVALPTTASDAVITLTAAPKGGGDALALPPMAPGRILLDVTSFREYGPHRISIRCALSAQDQPLVLDLLPEEKAGDAAAAPATVILTPAQPAETWGYINASPFRAGYRYRKSAAAGAPPDPWSPVMSPFAPLLLNADGTTASPARDSGGITAFDVNGIHLYGDATRPDTLYYLPAAPSAELDAQSRPTLKLMRLPQLSILQLGAQFTVAPADQPALLVKIAGIAPAFASARLQPAPITVQKAAVLLADASGKPIELKSSASSGYPPYSAIFSLNLPPEQAAQAIAAVDGRTGLLFVEYTITLPIEVATTLDGAPTTLVRRTDVASWFPASEGSSHLLLAG